MFTWDMIPRSPPTSSWKHWEKLRPPSMTLHSMAASQRNQMKISNNGKAMLLVIALLFSSARATRTARAADEYDVVILNGRVMDPESGIDANLNVGIRGGRILP